MEAVMASEVKKNDATKVKFKLTKAHTHKDEECEVGSTIELCKYQAERLQEMKVGNIVNG